jgi:hypothetical protein
MGTAQHRITANVSCPVCGQELPHTSAMGARQPVFECPVCGTYRLSERAAQHLYEAVGFLGDGFMPLANHHLLSAVIRERFEPSRRTVFIPTFEELVAAANPLPGGPLESVDRLLIYVSEHLARLGTAVKLSLEHDFPVVHVRDGTELLEVARMAAQLEYVKFHTAVGMPSIERASGFALLITPSGWARLQELRTTQKRHRQAFVAMWFDPAMDAVFNEGFEPALLGQGYLPLRIDRSEHNGKIDDRIVAEIRQSGLVVADFTGNRAGVYFEAGFARGLGIPVIWTCRKDYIRKVHFDTRQYNHIVWHDASDLATKLRVRIQATLPTYPAIAVTARDT